MAYRSLIAASILLLAGNSFAGYAQLQPPPGWVAGTGPGGMMPAKAANDATGGGWRAASAGLNAGGKAVKMPVSYRFAANAGRFIGKGFAMHPLALGAAGIAWLAEKCIEYKGGQFVLTCGPDAPIPAEGLEYIAGVNPANIYYPTPAGACSSFSFDAGYAVMHYFGGVLLPGGQYGICKWQWSRSDVGPEPLGEYQAPVNARPGGCPIGWYVTPAGCVQNPPPKVLSPDEVGDRMSPAPIPGTWGPGDFPPVDAPIELPKINPQPGTSPNSEPYESPMIIPQGDPVRVPNSDPARWEQPEVKVTPRGTPDSPWQVDLTPQNRPVPDPNVTPPNRDPWTPPVTPPNAPPDPNDPQPKPQEQIDLCEKYPDILACAKINPGSLSPDAIKNTDVPLEIKPEDGFPSGGQCPQPKTHTIMGRTFQFSVQPICDFATMIKPLLIGFAWLTAALTFMGVARREN